jgi:cytochrome c-type biogenesis protein CcmE
MSDWTATAAGEVSEGGRGWIKFAVGGIVIVAALALLLYTATQGNAQFFVTVQELRAREAELVGKDIRISGIVVPASISYDAETLHLEFDIVDQGNGAQEPLRIVMDGEPLPDQMQDEAEAIAEGRLRADGTFQAETLMMKCASKYDVEVKE